MSHCDDALRKIGRAIIDYQHTNDCRNPPELEKLIETQGLSLWDLVCPAGSFGPGQCSYVYRGEDLYADVFPEMILAYDKQPCHKGRRNILFANGDVKRPPEACFQEFIEMDNQLRSQLELPFKQA